MVIAKTDPELSERLTADAARELGKQKRDAEQRDLEKQRVELVRREQAQQEFLRNHATPKYVGQIIQLIKANPDKGEIAHALDCRTDDHAKYVITLAKHELEGLGYRVEASRDWVPPNPGSADDDHAYAHLGFHMHSLTVRW